jgi:hypothetical protein
MRSPAPGIRTNDRYRTVPEVQIVDMLLVGAFAHDLDAGRREAAVARVRASLKDWRGLGLGYRTDTDGTRLFDPVEVINRMKWWGVLGLDDFWASHFVTTARAFFSEWSLASVCRFGRYEAVRFIVDLHRKFDLRGIEAGRRVRVRLPLPISQSSEHVEVEPGISPNLLAQINRSDGRLDFQFANAGSEIEIAAKISFSTNGHSKDELSPEPSRAREIYLRERDGLVSVTSRVRDLSKLIAGTEKDPMTVATKLFYYIVDDFMCGSIHYDQIDTEAPGDWVLDHGWFDCQLGSALFVSMCRACGIPARILSGHVMYRLAPGFHYWAEAWIEGRGWTPFDFLNWDLSKAGSDLQWRGSFVGAVDYRLVTQCFPLVYTGPMSVRFPAAWHLVNRAFGEGMEIRFTELDGKLIYSDHISCRLSRD